MKVMKFGGTSVGTAERMKHVASLIQDGERNIVVISAMGSTTNVLVDIANCFYHKEPDEAKRILEQMRQAYAAEIDKLYDSPDTKDKALALINQCLDTVWSFSKGPYTMFDERTIVAQGELMSAGMVAYYLEEQGVAAIHLPALDFMRITKDSEPDLEYIEHKLHMRLDAYPEIQIFITEGFICRNAFGEIDNLLRGGSDYSASIIGAAIHAREIQIWTDIDGLHNNDPRFVRQTVPVRQLNFDEAAKLAHFGAKILHPECIEPAKRYNIPVRLLNTFTPDAPGTLISNFAEKGRIKAVAAKDGITYIKILSTRVYLNPEFLNRVFDAFARYKVPVDLISTSEASVSVAVEEKFTMEVIHTLERFATVQIDRGMVIVCVVGDLEWQNIGFEARIINALKDIPIRMISYGGSSSNVSLVLRASDKVRALEALNSRVFFENN